MWGVNIIKGQTPAHLDFVKGRENTIQRENTMKGSNLSKELVMGIFNK